MQRLVRLDHAHHCAVTCSAVENTLGLQILHAWPVPRDCTPKLSVRHHVTGSSAPTEASAEEQAAGAAGRQAGSQGAAVNGASKPAERQAAAGAGGGGEGSGEGRGPTEGFVGASWGREHAGELEEVVRWCAPKVAWEHLRLQLNVRSAIRTKHMTCTVHDRISLATLKHSMKPGLLMP